MSHDAPRPGRLGRRVRPLPVALVALVVVSTVAVVAVLVGGAGPSHDEAAVDGPGPSSTSPSTPSSPSVGDDLVDPVAERLRVARDVAAAKAASGSPVGDPDRERQVVDDALQLAGQLGAPADVTEAVVQHQIEASRLLQEAYLDRWGDAPPAPERPLDAVRDDVTRATRAVVEALAAPSHPCDFSREEVASVRARVAGPELTADEVDRAVEAATRPACTGGR